MGSRKRPMDVLLINAFHTPLGDLHRLVSMESDLRVPWMTIPQAILSLAAVARADNPQRRLDLLDLPKQLHVHVNQPGRKPTTIQNFITETLGTVSDDPDVVGVSASFSMGHSSSLLLAEMIKQKWPEAITVLGGVHATGFAGTIIEHAAVDYVIRGTGENSFCAFLKAIEEGRSPVGIPGVVDSSERVESFAEPLSDLDALPMPAYDLVDMEYYIRYGGRVHRREHTRPIPISFSRGCVFHCTFCASPSVHGRRVVTRTADSAAAELEHLVKTYGVNTIIVEDDLFGFDKPFPYSLCEKLKEKSLDLSFNFPNAFSVAVLNEKLCDLLVEMGMDVAFLGIESGSPHVQRHIIKKNCNLPKALRLSKYLRSKGIPLSAYFIFGFPGESVAMMQETIDFAVQMQIDWSYFSAAIPLVGSEMATPLMDQGILNNGNIVDIIDTTDRNVRRYDTPEISAADLNDLIYDANIKVNFLNNYNMLAGNYERAIDMFTTIVLRNYPFHVVGLACRAHCFLGLGDVEAAKRDIAQISNMVETHAESKRQYRRYGKEIDKLLKDVAPVHNRQSLGGMGIGSKSRKTS